MAMPEFPNSEDGKVQSIATNALNPNNWEWVIRNQKSEIRNISLLSTFYPQPENGQYPGSIAILECPAGLDRPKIADFGNFM